MRYGLLRRLRHSTHDAPVHQTFNSGEGASHGSPPSKAHQGPSQKSVVRPLPAGSICPMVGFYRWTCKTRSRVCRCNFDSRLQLSKRYRFSEPRLSATLRSERISMDCKSSVHVVLSDDLLSHLRRVAQEKHIPLLWLVAGLVCDTVEPRLERSVDHQVVHNE
jgi:hypothetical protein